MSNTYGAPPPPDPQSLTPGSLGPTAPGPEALQDQQNREALQRDLAAANADMQRAEAATGRATQLQGQKAEALAPLRQDLQKANAQPLPQAPQTQKPPPVPKPDDAQQQNGNQMWLTAAMFLGVLSGAMTRNHATNALAAFSGTLQGVEQGRRDLFEQNMKTWEAENKKIVEANKEANDTYLRILKSRELDFEQKAQAIQIAAARYDDQIASQLAEAKNFEALAKSHDEQVKYREQLVKATKETKQELNQREFERWKKDEGEAKAQLIAQGKTPWPSTVSPRGGDIGRMENDWLLKRVQEIKPGASSLDFVRQRQLTASEAQVTGRAAASIQLVMRQVQPTIENAARAAQAVPATAFPKINEYLQTGASALGDPALRNFQLANLELAERLANAMNPRQNVTSVTIQNRALEYLRTADSPEAYQVVLSNIARFVQQEFDLVEQQKRGDPMKPITVPDSTQRQLQPQQRQILPQVPGNATGGVVDKIKSLFPGATVTPMPAAPTQQPAPAGSSSQEFNDRFTFPQ